MAGVVGLDPMPLTLRQLTIAYEAKLFETWNHTAFLACIVHNVGWTKRKKAPKEFHPFESAAAGRKFPLTKAVFKAIKKMLTKE